MKLLDSSASEAALQYLEHCYKIPGNLIFPLPDEDFVDEWEKRFQGRSDFPSAIAEILKTDKVSCWIEKTAAGRIPVVYVSERSSFERLYAIFTVKDGAFNLPLSVNAFTVPVKLPEMSGHRVILLNKSGYSALSGNDAGIPEDDWVEKSAVIRLRHECCHYFTLRALGGMKNHILDEIVADCVGQLAALGSFSASLQRKFFGLSDDGQFIRDGGRLMFYVKKLPLEAIPIVCRYLNEALDALEAYLGENGEMRESENEPDLVMKLASAGIRGIKNMEMTKAKCLLP
jgi:hypothetical protein